MTTNQRTMPGVDRDVPLPKPKRRGAPFGNQNRLKYPWHLLNQPRDSFFAPNVTADGMRGTAGYQRKRRGWRFAVRDEGNGCRVWRTA